MSLMTEVILAVSSTAFIQQPTQAVLSHFTMLQWKLIKQRHQHICQYNRFWS